jgi:SAM-dependent methyltransferase
MHPAIQQAVTVALLGNRFRRSVDLGCGTGDGGELVKPHTSYLIGVDIDLNALKVAKDRGFYDELVHVDICEFRIPWGVDSVFLFDSIEHISKEEGLKLLRGLWDKFVMLTTPWWSMSLLLAWPWDGHVCTWSAEELRAEGFTVAGYSFFPDLWMCLSYGGFYVATRKS